MHELTSRISVSLVLAFLAGCSCSGSSNPDAGDRSDGMTTSDATDRRDGDVRDAGDPDEVPEDVREFLDARRRAECDRAVRCEGLYGFPTGPVCHPDRVEDWLDELPPGVTLDPVLAASCLEELSAPCDGRPIELLPPRACTTAIEGSTPEGEACDPDASATTAPCADGLYCPASGCPTCTPRRVRGESCVSFFDCSEGLACMQASEGDYRCVRVRELGESCDEGDVCAETLVDFDNRWLCVEGTCRKSREGEACGALVGRCEVGLDCPAGVCVVLGDEGDACPCDPSLLCSGGSCVTPAREADSACERHAHCSAPAAFCVGGRCVSDFLGANCEVDAECGQTARCRLGSCRPLLAFGDACTVFDLCPQNGRCDEGVCRAQVGPDGVCSPTTVCPHGFACEDARCVALPTIGEACTDRCATGSCNDGVCAIGVAGESCSFGLFTPTDSFAECEHGCEGRTCGEPSELGAPCRSCVEGAVCARRPEGPICVPAMCE